MDAAQALAELTEISSQIVEAAIVDSDDAVLVSTLGGEDEAKDFLAKATRLLEEADRLAGQQGLVSVSQLDVATLDGSVFAVRRDGRTIVATTLPDPTVGLVFYDLKHCLRSIEPNSDTATRAEAPARRTRKKAEPDA